MSDFFILIYSCRGLNNHELYELFNDPDIIKYIKINNLDWAGHFICIHNNRTVKANRNKDKWKV
jgi:hypothetical protein